MITLFDERLKSQYEASPEELERRGRVYDLKNKKVNIENTIEACLDLNLYLQILNPPQEIMNKLNEIKSRLEDLEKDVAKDLEELEGM